MKKRIGSRQAAELAAKKFGPRAYAKRSGKMFAIGVEKYRLLLGWSDHDKGVGKSWAEALVNAGITLPVDATIAREVHAALFADRKPFDAMPTDTDAKEPADNLNL